MNSESESASTPREDPVKRRGRLKIFFGMSPGVGKTYAMLQAARAKRKEGLDVVAGIVETHGRAETEALLEGLERLSMKEVPYRKSVFAEFDLDGMLERAPQIALVDELAHTNIPGGRHPKRYQDVRELLDSGIHVYTTMNVQHLESRADAVEALSSAQVRERVPDTVLEWADEIEIIDLSPEGLRQRLAEGKVYLGDRAATAADSFFSARNLAALREMALRSTAERVNRDLLKVLKQERDAKPLPTGERLMVAVGPSPFSERLVRWTKRYASSLNASWVAVHVDRLEPLDDEAQARLDAYLELARNLGAEVVSTSGEDVVESLMRTARRELATQVVVGRSPSSWWRRALSGGSLTDRLVAQSGPVAVHVVPAETEPGKVRWHRIWSKSGAGAKQYVIALGACLAMGLATYPLREDIGYWTPAMLFLALTVLGGFYLSRGPVLALALASALGWNFFYVPPQFTFRIHSGQDVLLFFILLLVAVTMGQLTARLRSLRVAEMRRETRTFALYRFLDCLNRQGEPSRTLREALDHASEVSGRRVDLVQARDDSGGGVALQQAEGLSSKEAGVATWAVSHRVMAGAFTQNLPEVPTLFIPVVSGDKGLGALKVNLEGKPIPLEARDLLTQMAGLLGRFLERENLRRRVEKTKVLEASQRLQKTLLDTVSHELKTPLTIILASLEQLDAKMLPGSSDVDTIREAERSARRLLRNVNMLLDLTRFEGGVVRPASELVDLSDLAARLRVELVADFGDQGRFVRFDLPEVVLRTDDGLLFQLLNQLLRNALGHTPPGTQIECLTRFNRDWVELIVQDGGPGLPENVEELFEAFSHGDRRRSKGLGLGLSIARRLCQILGGDLRAENRSSGGARFVAKLPVKSEALS